MNAVIFIGSILFCISLQAQVGYICVPVADLVAEPFNLGNKQTIREAYESLTVSPEQGKGSCLRVHQAIFNEKVMIIAYKNNQVQIVLQNCSSKAMMGLFNEPVTVWTLKDWIITQEELDQLSIDQSIFPGAYNETTRCDPSIITLITPWFDDTTQVTYSAGSRFCLSSEQTDDDHCAVMLYDHKHKRSVIAHIPTSKTISSGFFTPEQRRKMFVNLLYSWCTKGKSIPFVWGGTSFIDFSDEPIVLKKWFNDGNESSSWVCPTSSKHSLSGFDASGLILRAAQICGMSYYCCNSRTVANSLSLVPFSELQEGDILWAPGYVAIIASLQNNEIIEAQGYSRGYGNVHSISLKKRFADIETWDDFIYCCENKIPLKSLDCQGRCVAYVPLFKIYRLPC